MVAFFGTIDFYENSRAFRRGWRDGSLWDITVMRLSFFLTSGSQGSKTDEMNMIWIYGKSLKRSIFFFSSPDHNPQQASTPQNSMISGWLQTFSSRFSSEIMSGICFPQIRDPYRSDTGDIGMEVSIWGEMWLCALFNCVRIIGFIYEHWSLHSFIWCFFFDFVTR